jgi:hypothetical protein
VLQDCADLLHDTLNDRVGMAAPDSLMFSLLNGVLAKFRVPELPSTIGEQLAEVAVVLCSAIRDAVPWLRLPRVQVRLCFCVSLMGLSARATAATVSVSVSVSALVLTLPSLFLLSCLRLALSTLLSCAASRIVCYFLNVVC